MPRVVCVSRAIACARMGKDVDAQAGLRLYIFANENMIPIHICLLKCLISHAGMTLHLSKQVSRKPMPVLGIAGEYHFLSPVLEPHERTDTIRETFGFYGIPNFGRKKTRLR
jgi:hypothetical protein